MDRQTETEIYREMFSLKQDTIVDHTWEEERSHEIAKDSENHGVQPFCFLQMKKRKGFQEFLRAGGGGG